MIFWSLIALVVLAPIPFGSIYPWSTALMASVVGVLMLAWTVRAALAPEGPAVGLKLAWPLVAVFVALAGWIAVQMATWTPAGWHHPLWASAAQLLGAEIPGRISVDPFATGTGLMRLLTYGGIFWLALQYGRTPQNAYRIFLAVALAGLAYAVYGLAVEFTGAKMILWYEKERYTESLTSTFRYKNAYATYAGLGALCAVGLLLKGARDIARLGVGRRETLHQMVVRLAERGWVLAVAVVVIATALILSDSRAGFLSTGVGFLTLFIAQWAARGPRAPYLRTIIAVFVAAFVGFTVLSGDTLLDRLAQTDVEGNMRGEIYRATERAIADGPWLGTGWGTFAEVFRLYHPPSIPMPVRRAHSSYLENAMELGIPASILLAAAVAGIGLLCALGVRRRRRDTIYPCVGLAATVLVGLHAAVDFTMQVPAVAATYFLLAGAACAQSWSSLRRS